MAVISIIQDSREQCPWHFEDAFFSVRVAKLDAGDYAIDGDQDHFAIERKELNDFLGTISSGWERFLREIGRMDKFVAKVIIIEGDFIQTCFVEQGGQIQCPDHNHGNLTPQFIKKRIAELTMMNVSVLFCANAELAGSMATRIFQEREKERGK